MLCGLRYLILCGARYLYPLSANPASPSFSPLTPLSLQRRSSADGDEPRLDSVLESPGTRGPCSSHSSSTVGDPSTGCGGVVLPSSRDVKATHLEPVRAMFGQVEEVSDTDASQSVA